MNPTKCYCDFDSPLGRLCLQGDGDVLTGLYMPNHGGWQGPDAESRQSDASFAAAREQLCEYFAGTRRQFDLPIRLEGTPFQQRVWQQLLAIPFGKTITYGQLARQIGNPNASRAVGLANSRNPISIIVPCHRVIGSNGTLTGYAGGLHIKQWLIEQERQTDGTHLLVDHR